jgi:hypothetical protein
MVVLIFESQVTIDQKKEETEEIFLRSCSIKTIEFCEAGK